MYETKIKKITRYLKEVIRLLKESKKIGDKTTILAMASIELGIREKDVLEVLETFGRAKIIEINGEEVLV